ncbi:MAG: 23S rRNA (pseudouridine(1915)-N(3))-methyltransferase RlmH [Sphingobacteriales bacterium]|nr:MAG: 23S rRNA (pseudouridine(1915)-N(3))-methyltransferase RlmH [Sphingobacteriales bacterium]
MTIEIWSIGKESDAFIRDGVALYLKKTQPYLAVSLQIIPSPKKAAGQPPEKVKQLEEELIRSRLKSQHTLVVLDERGKLLTSEAWAKNLETWRDTGVQTLVILIGGAFGVTEALRREARAVWSLSTLVFPHQLVRLLVAEQLYRAFSILHGSGYHHA